MSAKRRGYTLECRFSAQFFTDPAMVQHIVAVRASCSGLQHGRTVQMADS